MVWEEEEPIIRKIERWWVRREVRRRRGIEGSSWNGGERKEERRGRKRGEEGWLENDK